MKGETPISESFRLSDVELEHARDLGAATYLSAYVNLMARRLKVEDSYTKEAVISMVAEMVEPINLGTQIAWCALMNDEDGANTRLEELRITVEKLLEKANIE
jgi:hypothetical protein